MDNPGLTSDEIDRLVLQYWPIEAAMQGKNPDYATLRAMVQAAVDRVRAKITKESLDLTA